MKKILVTGGNGQLGTELKRSILPPGWEVVAIDIDELDLTDTRAIATLIADGDWAAVISAGAYTAVDKAENDVVAAWAINALGPAALAAACRDAGIPIVQVSTDYVFGGDKTGAWEADDPVGPLGVYGASKLGGELAVTTSGARHVVLRTSWVVSAHGSNFVKTMLGIGAGRETVRVVADQYGAPTAAADLAAALVVVVVRLVDDPAAPTGTYHFSNAGPTTWADVATEIFAQVSARGHAAPRVERITTQEYPTAASRPANSILSRTAIERDYAIHARGWQAAISDILNELMGDTA